MQTNGTASGRGGGYSRRQFIRGGVLAGGALAVPSLLAACGDGGNGAERGATLDALSVGVFAGIPRGFDPAFSGLPFFVALLPVLEPLVAADVATGEFVPNLAERFEQVDPTTYTFDIREGVRFSDGSPLAMEDVEYSLRIHLDPAEESALAGDWASAESIRATGPRRLTIRLSEPNILFLTVLSSTGILKRSVREQAGDRRGTPAALPVGTGPYTIERFSPDQLAVLERNEGYWGEPAPIRTLTLRTVDDENTALASFRASQLDVVFNIPPLRSRQYEQNGSVVRAVDPEFTQVFFNRSIPPYDDVHVRRAIIHTIDREGIANSVYGGFATPAPAIVSEPLLRQVLPQDEVEALLAEVEIPFDMDLARAEIARSGSPDGFEARSIVNEAEPDLRQFALAIQDNLSQIGIRLQFEEVTQTQYTDRVFLSEPHDIGFGISTYGFNGYTAFEQILGLMRPGFGNLADYDSPEIRALTDRLIRLAPIDTEEIGEVIAALLREHAQDVVYGTIVSGDSLSAVREPYTYRDYSPAWVLGPWFRQLAIAS